MLALRRAVARVGLPLVGRECLLSSSSSWAGGEALSPALTAAVARTVGVPVARHPGVSPSMLLHHRGFAHAGGSLTSPVVVGCGGRSGGSCAAGARTHRGGDVAVNAPGGSIASLASYATGAGSNPTPGAPPSPPQPQPRFGVRSPPQARYGGGGRPGGTGGGDRGRRGREEKKFRIQEKAIVHVSSVLNNTFVTLTTLDGDTLAWSSGGTEGFKGSRRSTAYAAQMCGETIGKACVARKLFVVAARVKGPGYGKEASLRGLKMAGVKVVKIQDVSPTPHNGCRPKKKRRV